MPAATRIPEPGERVVDKKTRVIGRVVRIEKGGDILVVDTGESSEKRWWRHGVREIDVTRGPKGIERPSDRHLEWFRLAREGASHGEIAIVAGVSLRAVSAGIGRVKEAQRNERYLKGV
jgi:hypothetical protein